MNAGLPHIGDIRPREAGGFTWTCSCGAKADPVSGWKTYDAAAHALGRHVYTAEKAQRNG